MKNPINQVSSKVILSIGTEWFSKKGGLSTFNRQLCISLAKANQKVYCYLPEFTQEEADDAQLNKVILLRPSKKVMTDENSLMLNKPQSNIQLEFELIIGHDHVTGEEMKVLKEKFYPNAQTVFFVHTAPGEIEWYKPEQKIKSVAQKAEEKEKKQKELAMSATIVAAVGPHLFFETQSLIAGIEKPIRLIQFNPGLSKEFNEISFTSTSLTPEALMMGRLEDFHLKGVDIAVKAMHKVYNGWTKITNGIILRPKLILRGLAVGADEELIAKLKEFESSKLRVQPKNYNADIEVINEDIRKTNLVLVPSRAEGFGLVGLEAISNGRPVLMSEACGLAKLLQQIDPQEAKNWIVPEAIDDNIDGWAKAIQDILENRDIAAEKLRTLAKIYSSTVNWEASTIKFLDELAKDTSSVENEKANTHLIAKNEEREMIEPGIFKIRNDQYEIRTRKFDFFANRIASAFPGSRDLTWMDNPKDIIQRFEILLAEPLTFSKFPGNEDLPGAIASPIWWFRSGASMPIKEFKKLSETKCLVGWDEWEVEKIAIFRHPSPYREFVYLKTRSQQKVATNNSNQIDVERSLNFFKYVEQEYAIYKGNFITREEYDDGSAIINGKPETFTERPQLRSRFLTPYNLIITSQSSVYNSPAADRIFSKYLDDFLTNDDEERFSKLLAELEELDNERAYMLDYDV